MRTFERAFFIDALEEFVVKIVRNRKEIDFAPTEKKFQFTPKEYVSHSEAIDEFKTRHSTITDQIDLSNMIGLKLEEYLQN